MTFKELDITEATLKGEDFELLCPCIIWPFKPEKHALPPLRPTGFEPPDNYYQCYHLAIKQDGVALGVERCMEDSTIGFLCTEHDRTVLGNNDIKTRHRDYLRQRNAEAELVEGILLTESRAIARSKVDRIRLTAKGAFLQFIS